MAANILVLEDDPSLLFTFIQCLEIDGHVVTGVHDLAEARSHLRFNKPDLIILDYLISNRNSIQVADLASYACPDAQVIFVTGSGMFTNGQLFNMSSNISWVLRKPVDLGELREIVQFSLRRKPNMEDALSMSDAGVDMPMRRQVTC